jgi:hypothetical protein
MMTIHEAIKHAYNLHEMWVSAREIREGKGYDLARVHASMLQDFRYRRTRPVFADVVREIRGQFVLLGRVRLALGVK